MPSELALPQLIGCSQVQTAFLFLHQIIAPIQQHQYSGLNLNQDKATKPQTVQIVRQGEATLYWFKFNPLYFIRFRTIIQHDTDPMLLVHMVCR
ncbi:hypothetical protein NEIPOLOT_02277 [Neisseria polysaccharea ATCC 43768]|nr:hypothetical protein NEIPOLOT_02277 [Neisseria polysaccharea ATCC 43768]